MGLVVEIAPWIALAAAASVLLLLAVMGTRTWRAWRRTRVTRQAAVALLGVHQVHLEDALARLDELSGQLAADGEQLAGSIAELRADAEHLGSLLRRIPDEQRDLSGAMYDLVLPGGSRDRGPDDGRRRDA